MEASRSGEARGLALRGRWIASRRGRLAVRRRPLPSEPGWGAPRPAAEEGGSQTGRGARTHRELRARFHGGGGGGGVRSLPAAFRTEPVSYQRVVVALAPTARGVGGRTAARLGVSAAGRLPTCCRLPPPRNVTREVGAGGHSPSMCASHRLEEGDVHTWRGTTEKLYTAETERRNNRHAAQAESERTKDAASPRFCAVDHATPRSQYTSSASATQTSSA